jgi:hypothetical protein
MEPNTPESYTPIPGIRYSEPREGIADVYLIGTAPLPIITNSARGILVRCGCSPDNLAVALRDGMCSTCARCNTLLARCSNRVVAANWLSSSANPGR